MTNKEKLLKIVIKLEAVDEILDMFDESGTLSQNSIQIYVNKLRAEMIGLGVEA